MGRAVANSTMLVARRSRQPTLQCGASSRRGISSVSMETTPNPKSMKFVPEGVDVLGKQARSLVFRDIHEAGGSPLAMALLRIDGVREVMLSANHLTVTKATMVEWEALQETIEATILDFYLSGQRPVNSDVDVQRVRPETFEAGSIEARIVDLLEERVRPFVEQDGGDIEFDRFEPGDGTLYLQMRGSCSGCSQSHATLQEGVRNLMDHYIPEVKHIVGLSAEPEEEIPRSR